MKYRAVLPKKNSNVSHEHPLREFLILVAGSASIVLVVYGILGLFVDIAVDYISPEMEMAIYESVSFDYPEEFDTATPANETAQSTQNLLNELQQCIDVGYPVTLGIEESEAINAFAFPGGQMVVFSGLLENIKSENGLAFVLAHELAHFKNRDHLRSMGRSMVLAALSILFTGTNSDLSRIMAPVGKLEAAQHSQERESAADTTALQILNCHYGHVGGATELFEVIAEPDEFDLGLTFSSHPEAQERIKTINALSESLGYSIGHTALLIYR